MGETTLSEQRLVQVRAAARTATEHASNPFVDPREIRHATQILDRRGERWAAAVLGRDLTRRSLATAQRPFLYTGECAIIIAADVAEDRAIADQIIDPL